MKLKLGIECVIVLTLLLSGCATYNSATNRNELIYISTPQEVSVGVKTHQELSSKYKIMVGTDEALRLERIGQRLARFSDRKDYFYHFNLVDNDEINAFTTPGGYIYFYTGLFRKLKTDDQIAAVLAHEIGHCSAKHTIKKFQAALGYNWANSILDAVLSVKAPGLKPIVGIGASTAAQLAMTAYGRGDEYEADRLGIKYLYLAGFNLNDMINTFQILETYGQKSQMPLLLRTHPYIKDRIVAAKAEIERIQH